MRVYSVILLLCLLAFAPAHAQYNTPQNKIWTMGRFAGLDFTSGAPVPITSSIFSVEGSASVSDKDGNLLFYTEGRMVWDRTHAVMLGGDTICPLPSMSTTQGTVIVPMPDNLYGTNPTKYYIFSIFSIENVPLGDTEGMKLYYSMVDMSLNGGLGGIVPGTAGTYLFSHMCEKIIAIPGANCDMWVVTHRMDEPVLYSFNVSACGLNTTPVVSNAGTMAGYYAYGFGAMKSSHDNRKIAVFNSSCSLTPSSWGFGVFSQIGTELCDFNPGTGAVSNCYRVSTGSVDAYGDFSADNSKLYVVGRDSSESSGARLWQYNIADTSLIHSSKYEVASTENIFGDIRLAPDGKMYFPYGIFGNYYNRIAAPNATGAACTYEDHVIDALPGTYLYVGVPNLYNAPVSYIGDSTYSVSDTVVCFENTDTVVLTAPFSGCLRWYNGSGAPTNTVSAAGHYTLTSVEGCTARKHVFNVMAAATPCSTGVIQLSGASGISIFPIPATGQFTVKSDQALPAGSMARIVDGAGRTLRTVPLSAHQTVVSIAGLPAGVYQLHISGPQVSVVTRLITAP